MTSAVFTIVSRNYLAYAKTLQGSLQTSNPEVAFHTLIVDRKDPDFEAQHPDMRLTWVEDLGIVDFEHMAFRYDILELNTNVKPTFAKRLLQRYVKVIYLDPDIFVYGPLQHIFGLLDGHAIVLTPHITQPIDDDKLPGEPEFLNSGIYNLGFAGFNASAESLALLSWWEQRCLHLAFNEQRLGFFVDQKWLDFAPALCPTACILRDPQYNVAYWNLHERSITGGTENPLVNGRPLVFFHFSGLPPAGDDRISKYQTRYTLSGRPDVSPLFEAYRQRLNHHGHSTYLKIAYGFGTFDNGTPVSSLARRVFAGSRDLAKTPAPFSASGRTYQLLKTSRLLISGNGNAGLKPAPVEPGASEEVRLQRIAGILFRALLRWFGPARYERLMRYVARVSNLRGQSFLLRHKR